MVSIYRDRCIIEEDQNMCVNIILPEKGGKKVTKVRTIMSQSEMKSGVSIGKDTTRPKLSLGKSCPASKN